MPPRRSARVAAATEQRAWAFPQLPLPLAVHILSLLPADQRLRAAEVSRGWRATVALPALWRRLDLSRASGVALITNALLRAAAVRSGSALLEIDVTGVGFQVPELCAALRASGTVERLHMVHAGPRCSTADVTALLAAGPQLCELDISAVQCAPDDAVALLEGRSPFAPVRLHELVVLNGSPSHSLFLALADARQQPALSRLELSEAHNYASDAWEALADAVVARRGLTHFCLRGRALPAASASALARALARALCDGALTDVRFSGRLLSDATAATIMGDALRRASSTLTSLKLDVGFSYGGAATVTTLLGSLVGHSSLINVGRVPKVNSTASI